MSALFDQVSNILLLVFGFGFVIFWHELGHFLAAKWAGVRVDQFAVGFGQAIVAWRKGLGLTFGTGAPKVQSLIDKERERRAAEVQSDGELKPSKLSDDQIRNDLGISETEYRLNWIPLGGYVKMLGQDDLDPNATATDPHAYNMKPIGKRMVIVSAGVVMNVILAAVGFFVLFIIGFDVPPPVVGSVLPNSPAQRAGIRVGDEIRMFDGKLQRDFTKIQLNVALVKEGEAVPVVVHRAGTPADQTETLSVIPARSALDPAGLLVMGIAPSAQLEGMEKSKGIEQELKELRELNPPDIYALNPGEKIIAINGQPIDPSDKKQLQSFWKLDKAVQESGGKPVPILLSDGTNARPAQVVPRFANPFSGSVNFAGILPRAMIKALAPNSTARGKLMPGDVVQSVTVGSDTRFNPSMDALLNLLRSAGDNDAKINLLVLRNGQTVEIKDLETMKLPNGRRGIGVELDNDADHAVIGGVVEASAADTAKLATGNSTEATITRIGDQPITSFHDVRRVLADAKAGTVDVALKTDAGEITRQITLTDADIQNAKNQTYKVDLALHSLSEPRVTHSFTEAARWGFEETRDLIVQFYITLQRMFAGSLSPKNMMGPLGIAKAGTSFAERGTDYLIWFLAMISANLAVVNFLPIPIVDGGLFVFLLIEKFQGKPLSPKIQSIAQLVGIALIASVFIFVTYQDIIRH